MAGSRIDIAKLKEVQLKFFWASMSTCMQDKPAAASSLFAKPHSPTIFLCALAHSTQHHVQASFPALK
jgi:hypothetical protein